MSTYDPAALECLAAIVEEGGFERAAQRLNVTQSAVSQRLRALEAQVGSVLIVRSRPLKPTSAGQLLLKHTKQLRLLRADLERDLQELAPSAPGGSREDERISIAINADSIATWAMGALHDLVRQRLPLEIITDDQDFTQEWLRSGQVLGCVTTLKQALRHRRLRDIQALGGALETALFHDGGKAFQGGRIKGAHGLSTRAKRGSRAARFIRCADVFGVSLILLLVAGNVTDTA